MDMETSLTKNSLFRFLTVVLIPLALVLLVAEAGVLLAVGAVVPAKKKLCTWIFLVRVVC